MEIHADILETLGDTPLVRLSRFCPLGNVVAKVEAFNPGSSVKDRIGVAMIDAAEREGRLQPGGLIVEPTSGNTGLGLALVAALRGYRLICTVADKIPKEKVVLLEAFGVEVITCPTDVEADDARSYYKVAERIRDQQGAFLPYQYYNQANPQAHYQTTGPEIWRQTDGEVDVLVVGVGTGGTITGAGRYLKKQNADLQLVGADPAGSIYTATEEGEIHQYTVEGVGEDFYPETVDLDLIDRWVKVTDAESLAMTRRLAKEEGILVGGSCGMAVHAAIQVADEDHHSLVVVILPDSGRGYLSKVFNDDWMREHGFET
jgi:cystathionine beta-synthase